MFLLLVQSIIVTVRFSYIGGQEIKNINEKGLCSSGLEAKDKHRYTKQQSTNNHSVSYF